MTEGKIKENRAEWCAALRSGDFKQIYGCLKIQDKGYCCLGVACELYPLHAYLPLKVIELLGLTDGNQFSLVAMNDTYRKSFNEIADYIESLPLPSTQDNEEGWE